MAREAPRAVLFRRGPSKFVRLVLWYTNSDHFQRGQWLKGRIREEWADLSPDGTKLIYNAYRYHGNHKGEHWIAISRPPYLSALACWKLPNYVGSGNGRFESNDTVYVAARDGREDLIAGSMPASVNFRFWSEHSRARDVRPLQSDDHMLQHSDVSPRTSWSVDQQLQWASAQTHSIPKHLAGADWADQDQAGRTVFAREGRVYALAFGPDGSTTEKLLADFNDDRFEPIEAPDWATRW